MDERKRRAGRNEAIFREVNEQVEQLNTRFGAVRASSLEIVCECGNLECADRITVPIDVYEEVRSEAVLFVVARGHDDPEVEEIVRSEPDYDIVRKRPGGPAEIARATDTRH